MTEERKQKFLEGLRLSGSFRWAAKYASPAAGERGYDSFYRLRKRDPDFNRQVEEALHEALGKLEAELTKRAFRPDIRKQYDAKTGRLIGISKSWMPANTIAAKILARHDERWVDSQKRQVDTTVKITHDHGASGPIYAISLADLQMLPEEERNILLGLMSRIEDMKEAKQLPGAEGGEQLALPSPEPELKNE